MWRLGRPLGSRAGIQEWNQHRRVASRSPAHSTEGQFSVRLSSWAPPSEAFPRRLPYSPQGVFCRRAQAKVQGSHPPQIQPSPRDFLRPRSSATRHGINLCPQSPFPGQRVRGTQRRGWNLLSPHCARLGFIVSYKDALGVLKQ